MQEISKVRYQASGTDAEAFLHGQLTNDIKALAVGDAQLSAYLTPQGRTLAIFTVCRTADGFTLTLPAEIAATVMPRLKMFVLRAKVSIVEEGPAEPALTAALIAAGTPVILAATQDAFVPQMINLDLVDGVSFTKGCYPGQEIVARMKFLGKTKRRIFRFSGTGTLPVAGDDIERDGKAVGKVVLAANLTDSTTDNTTDSTAGFELLASIQINAHQAGTNVGEPPLTAGGVALSALPLPYDIPLDGSTVA